MGKSQTISHIVQLRQMLKQWRRKAHYAAVASDVPPGHVAVVVGVHRRRYVVPATHLNHPIFRRLLWEAEEEYGFTHVGPIAIPCDESMFEEILQILIRPESAGPITLDDLRRCCDVGRRKGVESLGESRPLLRGFAVKSVF